MFIAIVFSPIAQAGAVSPPISQRVVAVFFGVALVWRVVNGVGALIRWLWLGGRLGETSMTVFLVSVVVVPVIGAVGGDIAIRRGIWATTTRAHARRRESLVGVAVLPVVAVAALGWVVGDSTVALPLQGLTTLALVGLILLVERRVGPVLGRDE